MMLERVPGNTKEAKATVLMARDSTLPYRRAIRIAAAMVARERRNQAPHAVAIYPNSINLRALNGWQPEPKEIES